MQPFFPKNMISARLAAIRAAGLRSKTQRRPPPVRGLFGIPRTKRSWPARAPPFGGQQPDAASARLVGHGLTGEAAEVSWFAASKWRRRVGEKVGTIRVFVFDGMDAQLLLT